MLFLQGENQKAVVFNEFGRSNDIVILSNTYLSMGIDYYQYEFFENAREIFKDILIEQEVRWLLLYTNELKENLKKEINWIIQLEKEGIIGNSIIACR
jgi:hypothetical protein